jgi:hypothetical protein
VTHRSRRALQAGLAVACVVVGVGETPGGGPLLTTARSQEPEYGLPTPTVPAPAERGVPGVTNVVRPASVPGYPGPVLVCRAPRAGCRELTGEAAVDIGAYLDTSRGAVRLETRRADGTYAGTVVYAGLFVLQQARRRNALLIARLAGRLPTCPVRARASVLRGGASATKRKPPRPLPRRRLWSDGTGRFRATGRYGSATVRGTKWLIEERCAGTFVRVTRGQVKVDNRARHRTSTVRAPGTSLIRPR